MSLYLEPRKTGKALFIISVFSNIKLVLSYVMRLSNKLLVIRS